MSGRARGAALPDLFLVGAAKAGTTSLYGYLAQHPAVFAPSLKEPHWAAADLDLAAARGTAARDDYLALYADGTAARYRLDGSPSSLLSRVAAERIRALSPDAQVVIILRDPVETVPALHGQLALGGLQPDPDLRRALALADRWYGQPLDGLDHRAFGHYLDVVDHAPQLRRFLQCFPEDRVHLLWFDDLRADAAGVWSDLQDRLGLDRVPVDLAPDNTAMHVDSVRLQRLVTNPPFKSALRRVVPRGAARALRRVVGGRNVRRAARDPLPEDLEAWLRQRVRPMVENLEALTGRDLTEWKEPA